jgi:hypothetical protein
MVYITTKTPSATKDNGPVLCLGKAGLGNNCFIVVELNGSAEMHGWECQGTWQETIDFLAGMYPSSVIAQATGE